MFVHGTKTIASAVLALTVCIPLLLGCKREQPPSQAHAEFAELQLEVAKLEADLTNATPDLQQHVALLKHALRYGQATQAGTELEYLANNQELSPAQKEQVTRLRDQTAQFFTNSPAPPSP